MGLQIRDDRQMKALTGLSQAQFDSLLPIFSDLYQTTQQQSYEDGVKSGTRRRRPGGGVKGKWPTVAEKLPFVLYPEIGLRTPGVSPGVKARSRRLQVFVRRF